MIFCLDLVNRLAMAASSTRNALAISPTVRPPSSRRVSATWALVASAGWQQVNIKRSRSSTTEETGSAESPASLIMAACACWLSRFDSRRIRSIARLAAVVVSQAAGIRRQAGVRPALQGDEVGLLGRLLGDIDIAEAAGQGGDDPTVLLPENPVEVAMVRRIAADRVPWHGRRSGARLGLERPDLDGTAAGSGTLPGELERGVQIWDVDDPESAEVLLGLEVGTVGDHRFPAAGAIDDGRGRRRVEAARKDPDAGSLQLPC